MKMPWTDKTGLAKAAVIFAVLLIVSIGLCGANLALYSHTNNATLLKTGILEVFGMVVGAGGLVVVGLVAVVKAIVRGLRKTKRFECWVWRGQERENAGSSRRSEWKD